MIDNLIIIIPTHNRQHYLRRVIKYYSSFPCKVFICDSSKEKAEIECCDIISYRWVPKSNFYGKVLDVLNETNVDFYALSPDDDFIKQETLVECYEKLSNNTDFSIGCGRQILFKEQFDGVFINPSSLNLLQGILKQNPTDRNEYAKFFMEHYQNILWSLFRRDVIVSAFKCLQKCNFSNGNFVEIVLSIESLKRGKVYLSHNGMNYREIVIADHWGSTTPSITRNNLLNDKNLHDDILRFKQYSEDNEFEQFCFEVYLDAQSKPSCVSFFDYTKRRLKILFIRLLSWEWHAKIDMWRVGPAFQDTKMVERINASISHKN